MIDKTVLIIAWEIGKYVALILLADIMLILILRSLGHTSDATQPANETTPMETTIRATTV